MDRIAGKSAGRDELFGIGRNIRPIPARPAQQSTERGGILRVAARIVLQDVHDPVAVRILHRIVRSDHQTIRDFPSVAHPVIVPVLRVHDQRAKC